MQVSIYPFHVLEPILFIIHHCAKIPNRSGLVVYFRC